MYCGLSVKINTRETPHGMQRSWTHFVCVYFRVCGQQNPNTPNWSSMADEAITQGGIGVLGSLFYVCGADSEFVENMLFSVFYCKMSSKLRFISCWQCWGTLFDMFVQFYFGSKMFTMKCDE